MVQLPWLTAMEALVALDRQNKEDLVSTRSKYAPDADRDRFGWSCLAEKKGFRLWGQSQRGRRCRQPYG